MMDAEMLSKFIRAKKKKVFDADPELVNTDSRPDMTPQDTWDTEKHGYVEEMTDSPHRINSDETSLNEPDDTTLRSMDMARMGRLRTYLNSLEMW